MRTAPRRRPNFALRKFGSFASRIVRVPGVAPSLTLARRRFVWSWKEEEGGLRSWKIAASQGWHLIFEFLRQRWNSAPAFVTGAEKFKRRVALFWKEADVENHAKTLPLKKHLQTWTSDRQIHSKGFKSFKTASNHIGVKGKICLDSGFIQIKIEAKQQLAK